MRILIVSDTHGYDDNFIRVLKKTGEPDLLIHAGDLCGLERDIRSYVGCEVKMVAGNNDFSPLLKREEVFEAGGIKFLLTHGHRERVYYGIDNLVYKGLELGVDVVVCGHTHKPFVEYDDRNGIYVVNPGSLSLPRQFNRKPSFIMADIDRNGEIHFTVSYI